MARSRQRSPRTRQGEFVDILADASRGIVRSSARAAIPDNAVYDSADFMLDQPGVVYKRGGSSYFGPDFGASGTHYAASVAFADFATGSQIVAITEHGAVYKVESGTVTGITTLATGAPGIDMPKLARQDKLIIIDATHAATAQPRVYNGTAVTLCGGSPPFGRYFTMYKTRLVMGGSTALRNRTFFSPTPDIESMWDTANAYIDHDLAVTGYAPLPNMLLVFGEGKTERLVGSTPPPLSDFDRGLVGHVGCTDARSIGLYEGSAIFANTRGVYISNGGTPRSLMEDVIETYWQSLFTGYDRSTWVIAGGVHRSFYFVNVLDAAGDLVVALMCHIPRQAWWRYTGNRGMMFASSVGVKDELYVADRSAERLRTLSGFFEPTAANKNDADGTAVTPLLETRLFGRGTGLKVFGRGRLTYDMREATAGDDPRLAVTVAEGVEAPTFTAVPESPVGETANAIRSPGLTVARESQGVTVRLQQSGPSSQTEIYALEVETRPLPLVAIGPAA